MVPILELVSISHHYHSGTPILTNFSFAVEKGEIACLLGPSGCGKSTALRIMAGFERPQQGRMELEGKLVEGFRIHVAPEKRSMGVVFQEDTLFPHLCVAENIEFGLIGFLRYRRKSRVIELLELIDLVGFENKYPHELSGGQRQRVALARAMAPRPGVILLDEPFASLDAELSKSLGAQLRKIIKDCDMTAILVTHDQDEAFNIADRIAVLHQGRIRQIGTAYDLFRRPQDAFVAGFIGDGDFLKAECHGNGVVSCIFGKCQAQNQDLEPGEVELMIRPENLLLDSNGIEAEVINVIFRGSYSLYVLRLADGQIVRSGLTGVQNWMPGQRAKLALKQHQLPAFEAAKTE